MLLRQFISSARTSDKGSFGDGKIFVSPVDEVYTVSSGIKEIPGGEMEEVPV